MYAVVIINNIFFFCRRSMGLPTCKPVAFSEEAIDSPISMYSYKYLMSHMRLASCIQCCADASDHS